MKRTPRPWQDETPHFDLRMENELLMLKLRAEFGAECTTGSDDIPPAVVQEFLRSVYAFEKSFRESRSLISVFDKIGKPFFRKAEELSPEQLGRELARMRKLLRDNRLELDVLGKYPDEVIYRFLTEEFLPHHIEDLDLPGFVNHFCYEDFHPDPRTGTGGDE